MNWICQIVCVVCLIFGITLICSGREDRNEQLEKIGYTFLIICIFLFSIWIFNFKN